MSKSMFGPKETFLLLIVCVKEGFVWRTLNLRISIIYFKVGWKYYLFPSQCFLDVYILVHFLISWSTNWVPYIFPQTLIFYISISLYFLYIYIIRICIYFHTSTPQVIFVTANTADGSVNFFQQCKFLQISIACLAQKF